MKQKHDWTTFWLVLLVMGGITFTALTLVYEAAKFFVQVHYIIKYW